MSVDGVRLFVERHGRGEPVLMIPGLGAGNWLWAKNIHALAKHFSLIMPELRGSGRSDKPDQLYKVALFAADVKAVLDQLDIGQAHVLGASLGGFVAQYFAATWPERVNKLVLVSTSLGGQSQLGPDGDILSRIIRPRGKTSRERLENAYAFHFTEEFRQQHPEELERITAWRTQHPQPEHIYYRQLLAGNAYDGEKLAEKIIAPTLICAGQDDPLVPPQNAHALQKKIPQARLAFFAGRHIFFFEQSRKFNQTVIEFLDESFVVAPLDAKHVEITSSSLEPS
ncbi:MAG: alpha/beta hydrolase [candidate division KSB1 bacterium]|nr:alpha/beta hydrolase [candidate division KSB1 bacterium]MDZ7365300.1 alpha/beta hydrolase [candidate division KSB1 bacterium]MDZ7403167.1 alpha/beta hydrolase [candidate division KSB1 bacterium]